MARSPADIAVRTWARLARAQRLVQGGVESALKAAGLPPLAWYDVLLELERAGAGGLRPQALQDALLLAQYNLSRLLDRMEAAGYVERWVCADDRRGRQVAVTPAGASVRRAMWPVYARAVEAGLGAHLAGRELADLEALLGLLVAGHTAGAGPAATA